MCKKMSIEPAGNAGRGKLGVSGEQADVFWNCNQYAELCQAC